MNTDVIVAHVASDGTRKVFRQGAGNEGPRPLDDEELEAVAGGADFRVTFTDGCVVTVQGVDNGLRASQEALNYHRTFTDHTNHDHSVDQI